MQESNLEQNLPISSQNNIQQPQQTVENQIQVSTPTNKTKLPLILIAIFALLIILGSGAYYLGIQKTSSSKACPEILRICNDGKAAKPGPNCTQICSEDYVTPTDVSKINNFNLTSSKENIDENWNSYKDNNYNLTVKYPNSWKVNELQGEYLENIPTFEIKTQTTFKTPKTYSNKIGVTVGSPFIFSTSGTVCANRACDEVGRANININGKIYSTSIIRASYNKNLDPKQNIFEYYAFQFELKDVKISLPGYTEKISPAVTAFFYTKEEGQTITNILSTFKFTN